MSLPAGLLLGGCGSAQTFQAPLDVVWQAAMTESIVWRPTSIDEQTHTIAASLQSGDGTTIEGRVEVAPFFWSPQGSTRVRVSFQSVTSPRRRYLDIETLYLQRVASYLQMRSAPR